MKSYYFLIMALILSCSNANKKQEQKITGQYARYYKDEYTTRYDTLAIQPVSDIVNGLYKVEKRSSYQKTWENKTLPEKRESRHWTSEYQSQTASLLLQPGLSLYFDKGNEQAILGNQRYKKIN